MKKNIFNNIKTFKKWLIEKRIKPIKLEDMSRVILKYIIKNVEKYLNENYKNKIDPKEFVSYLLSTYQLILYKHTYFLEIKIITAGENKQKIFNILFPLNKINELEKICKNRGYFISGLSFNEIRFQPYVNETLLINPPRFLFHITPLKNKNNILKKGLIPKEGKRDFFRYPPRVYFIKNYGEHIFDLYKAIQEYDGKNYEPWIIFEIDTTKLRKNTKFYIDSEFDEYGCWTYTHIPPTAITAWKTETESEIIS